MQEASEIVVANVLGLFLWLPLFHARPRSKQCLGDLTLNLEIELQVTGQPDQGRLILIIVCVGIRVRAQPGRSEEHTSELQSQSNLVCRLLLEKKKTNH